jgi:hypothetical protein
LNGAVNGEAHNTTRQNARDRLSTMLMCGDSSTIDAKTAQSTRQQSPAKTADVAAALAGSKLQKCRPH